MVIFGLLTSIFLSVCIAKSPQILSLCVSKTSSSFCSYQFCNVGRSSSLCIDQLCHVYFCIYWDVLHDIQIQGDLLPHCIGHTFSIWDQHHLFLLANSFSRDLGLVQPWWILLFQLSDPHYIFADECLLYQHQLVDSIRDIICVKLYFPRFVLLV